MIYFKSYTPIIMQNSKQVFIYLFFLKHIQTAEHLHRKLQKHPLTQHVASHPCLSNAHRKLKIAKKKQQQQASYCRIHEAF